MAKVIAEAPPPSRRGKRGPDKQPRRRRGSPKLKKPYQYVLAQGEILPPEPKKVERIRERVKAMDEAKRRAMVPKMIKDLLIAYFGWDRVPEHMLELLNFMFEGGKWVVNWPTDHAKSTTTTFLFPILSLMNDPNESHIVCGANLNDSKSWVQTIQRELETNNALLEDFPWVGKPDLDVKSAWSTTQLTVRGRTVNKRNPSILALGAGSNDIRGRRGKLILDDIEGEKHQWSPLERQRLFSWVKQECIRTYEDVRESSRPLLLLCGTPFDVDSIYFKLEGDPWRVHRRMVYTDPPPWRSNNPQDHAPPFADRNYLLWPAKFEKVHAQWKDMSKAEFAIAYLMDPKEANPGRLTLKEIQRLTSEAEAPDAEAATFISLDAASGSTQSRADYAGLAVVRARWPKTLDLPMVQVLKAKAMREGMFEQVLEAARLAREYHCAVIYEVDGLGSVYGNAFRHLAPDVKLVRSRTRDFRFDKDMGITVIPTLISRKHLSIPESEQDDEGMATFRAEVRDLGGMGHDHISAAVWFVVRWLHRQIKQYDPSKIVNAWGGPRVGPPADYIDREPVAAAQPPAVNGWSIRPYQRFGR